MAFPREVSRDLYFFTLHKWPLIHHTVIQSPNTKILLFADDFTILIKGINIDKIQLSTNGLLERIHNWLFLGILNKTNYILLPSIEISVETIFCVILRRIHWWKLKLLLLPYILYWLKIGKYVGIVRRIAHQQYSPSKPESNSTTPSYSLTLGQCI